MIAHTDRADPDLPDPYLPNPYLAWVEGFVTALRAGAAIGAPEPPQAAPARGGPPAAKVLVFAPHPDDEVITGALSLRLMRECGFEVTDVAVTLGSKVERRMGRWRELGAACAYIGFTRSTPDRTGLEGINLATRAHDPARWALAVEAIAEVLAAERPAVVCLPHAADWNSTHIGTHHLVVEALSRLPGFACHFVETEYWAAMAAPNLMIEFERRRRRRPGRGLGAARGRGGPQPVSSAAAGLDDRQCAPRHRAGRRPGRRLTRFRVRYVISLARLAGWRAARNPVGRQALPWASESGWRKTTRSVTAFSGSSGQAPSSCLRRITRVGR